MKNAIFNLKEYIRKAYESTSQKLAPNIVRGHLRSISTDIEDGIGLFLSEVLPEDYQILLDPSIHVDGKNNRPDALVTDSNMNVVAMIEIKANMGWCRDASWVLGDIVENDSKFKEMKTLNCEFSSQESIEVKYGEGVKLFLISLTDSNCPAEKHEANKRVAAEKGVHQFNLFSGWYGSLEPLEIQLFIDELLR